MRIGPQKGPQPDRGILPAPLSDMTRQPHQRHLADHQSVIASRRAPAVARAA